MPERAEIEAVLAAVGSPGCNCRSKAEAALDRVRDARGGEETARCPNCGGTKSDPRGSCPDPGHARSPQGEDHELGDDWRAVALQLADALRGLHPQNPYYREKQAEALVAFDVLAGESNEGGNQ